MAPLCACLCACVCCTRVSGYAAHRKQTAARIHFPTHTHRHTHTEIQPHTGQTAAHTRKTHTHTKPQRSSTQYAAVFSNVRYTHFPQTPKTHTHNFPTHMKNKHSHEKHPHTKTNAHSLDLSHTRSLATTSKRLFDGDSPVCEALSVG